MKAVVMGGPQDGAEKDIPSGQDFYVFPVRPTRPLTLRDLTSPYVESATVETTKWKVIPMRSPAGRRFMAIIDPKLHTWLSQHFDQNGRKADRENEE